MDADVIIIGAGPAGMMCGIEAARRGRSVLVLDHAKAAGEKIRISGGGRCNFTNLDIQPDRFLSQNPRFALSALKRYTQWDFIAMVDAAGIPWHEKTLGQLFCDRSAKDIIAMLLGHLEDTGARLRLGVSVGGVSKQGDGYRVETSGGVLSCAALVVACGGKSIPKMGATGFGYDIARQFGLPLVETRPALVPLTFAEQELAQTKPLAGASVQARVACKGVEDVGVTGNLADQNNGDLERLGERVHRWKIKPVGSEGYRTAEVTLGGVSTEALQAKTMEAKDHPGLYFIGEVVDVTGWLGGYNFQWAWSSGWAAGQVC